jgi:TolB-like protein/Tfp pilus assembly protein PilF
VLFAFGDYLLDVGRRELRRAGERIALEPQVFDLLVYLIRNRDHVVSKDDLMENIWGGRIVSESSLTTRINSARTAVGDSGAAQQIIRTIPRKGVRFVAEVRDAAKKPATVLVSLELPDKPSIAVLPFANLSGDTEQEYFADGMVEEIITALSRIRWLLVIARNSTFIYKGKAVDVKQVARDLGVRYVLEGSVRRAAERLRITAQLIDATSGAHIWADHFGGSLEDVFDLQDKVASNVAAFIEPALQAAETALAANRPTTDLSAYDAYLRAYAIVFGSAQQIPQALALLEEAIERDPNYGLALAWAAICCMRLCIDGTSTDSEADRRKGAGYARRALKVGGDDPGVLANAAFALAHFGEDLDAMMALADRALTLNPNFARGWTVSSRIRAWAGELDAAIEHAETALRLSPHGGVGSVIYQIGFALLLSRRFEEAIPKLLLASQNDPNSPVNYRALAACYAHLGRLDEARATLARLRTITPHILPNVSHWRKPEHREIYLSGLRLAGGDEVT